MATITKSPAANRIDMEMAKQIEELQKANAILAGKLQEKATSRVSFKVAQPRQAGTNGPGDKGSLGGSLSVYGLGRFPVSLYKEQWKRLLSLKDDILAYIEEHDSELSEK